MSFTPQSANISHYSDIYSTESVTDIGKLHEPATDNDTHNCGEYKKIYDKRCRGENKYLTLTIGVAA